MPQDGIVELRYPDGSLRERCTYANGVIVGDHRYFRPADPDVEAIRALDEAAPQVHAFVVVHDDHGDRIGARYEDAAGREVDSHGEPVPARPAGVWPTAFLLQSRWHVMRHRGDELVESREWDTKGRLREEQLPDGTERGYHASGKLHWEGHRARVGGRRPEHGTWRTWDRKGVLRRESEYDTGREVRRTWHRPASEAGGRELSRSGPIVERVETGTWVARDGSGATRTIELGAATNNDDLLADYELHDEEVDRSIDELRALAAIPGARGLLAQIRIAGREGLGSLVQALDAGPPWHQLDDDGQAVPLGGGSLAERVSSLWWGASLGPTLAGLAAQLFAMGAPNAALDVIDAALRTGDDAAWANARVGYLRRLGRGDEADAATRDDPRRLGELELRLLAAIREQPDDDGPRLVFADAIAERDPVHAALIVAQCNLTPADDGPLRAEFLASLPASLAEALEVVRGFANIYGVDAQLFVADPDLVYRVDPLSGVLRLSYASGHVAQLAVMPALRRYDELAFYDTYLFDGGSAHLARSPHLAQLRALGLYNTSLDDEALQPILESTAYPRLERLDLGNGRDEQDYTLAGLQAIASARFAGTLTALDISRRYFDAAVVDLIAQLPRLVELELSGAHLGDAGIAALAALPHRFRRLGLHMTDFGPPGAEALARSPVLSELESLDLGAVRLDERGFAAIVGSSQLRRLHTLALGSGTTDDTRATAAVARALAASSLPATLVELGLSGARIGAAGARALATAAFEKLVRLNLYGNRIGDEGGVALAASPVLRMIHFLDLGDNNLGDDTAFALAGSPHLDAVGHIGLGGATLSTRAKRALSKRFGKRVRLVYPWSR